MRQALDIDDFRLLPAGRPPHRSHTYANAADRLAMLHLAVQDQPCLGVDEREMRAPRPVFHAADPGVAGRDYPRSPLLLVLGQDSANTLDHWHRWRDILPLAHLVVMTRPDEVPRYTRRRWRRKCRARAVTRCRPAAPCNVAAWCCTWPCSRLRFHPRWCASGWLQGLGVDEPVPPAVLDYIRAHGLYGCGPGVVNVHPARLESRLVQRQSHTI